MAPASLILMFVVHPFSETSASLPLSELYLAFRTWVELEEADISSGVKLRTKTKASGEDISCAGPLGRAASASERLGPSFLTGDRAFSEVPHVGSSGRA